MFMNTGCYCCSGDAQKRKSQLFEHCKVNIEVNFSYISTEKFHMGPGFEI